MHECVFASVAEYLFPSLQQTVGAVKSMVLRTVLVGLVALVMVALVLVAELGSHQRGNLCVLLGGPVSVFMVRE